MRNYQERLLTGSIAVPALLLALYTAHIPKWELFFLFTTLAIISTAVWELLELEKKVGDHPLTSIVIGTTNTYLTAVFIAASSGRWLLLPETILLAGLLAVFLYHFYKGQHPLHTIATSIFPIAYLVIPLGTAISIVYFFPSDSTQDGRLWMLFLIAVVKFNDIAAYVVGKLIGKHPLTRYISPKKTWEGAIAGILAAELAGYAFHSYLQLPLSVALILAFLLTIVAQFGDLAESLLKRDAGTKDSNSLPGLGGVLDVVDAMVFASPLMYIFLKFYFPQPLS